MLRATNPDGVVLYEADWEAHKLRRLTAKLPDHRTIQIGIGRGVHPVIGACDEVRVDGESQPRAFCGHIDWNRPEHIPPLDRPGALPPGGGAALLNLLAGQAQRAGADALRYRGPYPTTMLFDSLLVSFEVRGEVDAARARFVEGAEEAAVTGRVVTPDVAFVPAPHTWHWPDPRVCVQQRDAIDRVWVDGCAFLRDLPVGRSLRAHADGTLRAVVAVGHEVVAEIVVLDADGRVRGQIGTLPPAPADLEAVSLPDEVVPVLAEALAAEGSPLLAAAVHAVVAPGRVRWGETGMRLVVADATGVTMHAGLVAHLPTDPVQLLGTLVSLLGWPVRQLAQRHLSDAAEAILRR